MSSLDKLAIRGIRSFDHNDFAVMQFYTPLTVIVGHNGSGKTTIIECLKYATTGDLPPNTKGGAFVHDPSIAGMSEVKAQVKLRFFSARKERILVERRLQVTKKKTGVAGLTMKTLESNITMLDEGKDSKKRNSLSTKCANLDEEVALQLGVSKAILENVIFCHQEDSNWPLAEPAALKKKFDDIFEATKYTKALDNIKTLRKDQDAELKVDKEKLAALKTDRDRATKLRKSIDESTNAIAVKQSEHEALEEEITKIVERNKTFFTQASKYQDIIGKADTLRERRTVVEDNLTQVQANLTELHDTEVELQKKIENHTADIAALRSSREDVKRKAADETDSLAAQERKRSTAQTSHGRLLAQKQRHEENVEMRQMLVRELSVKHGIDGYDHDRLGEEEIREFEEKLDEAIAEQAAKVDKIKRTARTNEQQMQAEIQTLKSAQAADESAARTIAQQIAVHTRKVAVFNRQLDATSANVGDVTIAEASLRDDQKRKTDLENKIREADYDGKLRVETRKGKELEEQRDRLHDELTSLNAQADVRAKLQLKRNDVLAKEEAIKRLVEKATPSYRKLFKADPARATMETEINGAITTAESELAVAEESNAEAKKQLQQIESAVGYARGKTKGLTDEAKAYKQTIDEKLAQFAAETGSAVAKSVQAAIKEAEEEVELTRKSLEDSTQFASMFQKILESSVRDRKCFGCDRKILPDQMDAFRAYCRSRIQGGPGGSAELKADLDDWVQSLEERRALLPTEVAYLKLIEHDIPAAEREVEAQNARLPAVIARTNETGKVVKERKDTLGELQNMKRPASDVTRTLREVQDLERDIGKLESELQASGSTATTDDITQKLHAVGEDIRVNKATVDRLRVEQQSQSNLIQSLIKSIHANEMDLAKKRQEIKEREDLERQKEAERAEIETLEARAKEVNTKLAEAAQPIRKREDELAQARNEAAQKEVMATRELQSFNKSAEQLALNKREIQTYESRGGAGELIKVERELKQYEGVIADMKKRISALQDEMASADRRLADSHAVLRNLHDNVRLRKSKRDLATIDSQLESLDDEGARKAYRRFETEYTAMRQKQSQKQSDQAKLGGELATMRSALKEKKEELVSEYDRIEEKYKQELVKVKTTEVVSNDLLKYAKALDAAIMAFHSLKMKEINDTIAHLWMKTYQGTDIDKIMLKSDSEGKVAGTKASYNYRVVMMKDQVEMDMRGRCSAGQKVLASIIIRLALAESFGTNCGIMALDEPTTNLDQDNIKALASALGDIIKDRRSQANFQLIIITHDEQFLETLGGSGVIDKYFRVSRGGNGQVSTIERQRLN
ncbi:BZ3500_MvSof-1268-A1-R1_Chr3-2g06284 [Microbotryum saponariae]|uniref:DNA repair protein RAD50 n=1 Tax=Microbotryum saponariae TaxID=289078 RepID=A0A2X0KYT5_9BASI|nr:BZ3500_MvSof-1268-A1-R1_Chr3-2g06284 [Microbotryum saponariae]SDA04255.1 BZ3501_MvSof-1269-A2-R1_Chr3-2g05975 [Microbotryum saponariae]